MKKVFTSGLIAIMVLLMPKSNFAQVSELGSSANFAFFTSVGAFTNVGASQITGDVGTNAGPLTGFPPGTIIGTIQVENAITVQASTDVAAAYTYFSTRTCGTVLVATLGGGQIITPDVYCIGTAIGLNGDLVLDAQNDPTALFIIQIDGALSTATNSKVVLLNGACSENVFWQVSGAVEIGNMSEFKGSIIANGAISLLEGASLTGRGLTKAGAIDLHNNIASSLGQCNSPLAIKLSNFSAVNMEKSNKINWTSLSEGDGDYFELERSIDANNFQKIATIQTKGSQLNYQYLDEFAPSGLSYYRLKMNELGGKFTYSQMALANNKPNAELALSAFPNPVKDFLNVTTSAKKGPNSSINIVDITGKSIDFIPLNENETQVNMTKYSQGIYFVKYNNGQYSQTLKVIKQ